MKSESKVKFWSLTITLSRALFVFFIHKVIVAIHEGFLDGLIAASEANYANLSALSTPPVPLLSARDCAVSLLSFPIAALHFPKSAHDESPSWWFMGTGSVGLRYFISAIILSSNFQGCGYSWSFQGLRKNYIRSWIMVNAWASHVAVADTVLVLGVLNITLWIGVQPLEKTSWDS